MRFTRVCAQHGCSNLVRTGYCDEHRKERKPWRKESLTAGRPRGARWTTLRRTVIQEQPRCAWPGCNRPSVEVDHITPLSEGGEPWLRSNLQGLCVPHHEEKSRAERVRPHRTKGEGAS